MFPSICLSHLVPKKKKVFFFLPRTVFQIREIIFVEIGNVFAFHFLFSFLLFLVLLIRVLLTRLLIGDIRERKERKGFISYLFFFEFVLIEHLLKSLRCKVVDSLIGALKQQKKKEEETSQPEIALVPSVCVSVCLSVFSFPVLAALCNYFVLFCFSPLYLSLPSAVAAATPS